MLFRLEPQNVNSPDWEGSTYRDVVIVRASIEEEARACAATAFEYVRDGQSDDQSVSPWKQPELATCAPVEDPSFEAEGPTMVISPAFFD